LKEGIEGVFKSLLQFMFEEGYIRLEEYYCDGTTLQADANKHKVTWKKNIERVKETISARIDQTIQEIDRLNREENALYGTQDLAIKGTEDASREARIEEQSKELSRIANPEKEKQKRIKQLNRELTMDSIRLKVYEDKAAECGERCGYSSTDPEATPMRTKECQDDLRPAYNGMIGTENQFITGVTVHQNPNDATCFKEHLEEVMPLQPATIKTVVADSIFGTEENYNYLENKEIEALLKFPSYDKEQTKAFKETIFHKDNMLYDAENDQFICPNKKNLRYIKDEITTNKNGFASTHRVYECECCAGCPFRTECGLAEKDEAKNRQIKVNRRLEAYKQRTREKLQTDRGQRLYKQRGHDVETCFGDSKGNQLFRRMHLRGIEKVKTEFTVMAMSHNLRKMQISIERSAA
jgi:hypothetical protein